MACFGGEGNVAESAAVLQHPVNGAVRDVCLCSGMGGNMHCRLCRSKTIRTAQYALDAYGERVSKEQNNRARPPSFFGGNSLTPIRLVFLGGHLFNGSNYAQVKPLSK